MTTRLEIVDTPELFRCRERPGYVGYWAGLLALATASLFCFVLWFVFTQHGQVRCEPVGATVTCTIEQSGPLGVFPRQTVVEDVRGVEIESRAQSDASKPGITRSSERLVLRLRTGGAVPISRFGFTSGFEAQHATALAALAPAFEAGASARTVDVTETEGWVAILGGFGAIFLVGAAVFLRSFLLLFTRPREIVVSARRISVRNTDRARDVAELALEDVRAVESLRGGAAIEAAFPALAPLAALTPRAQDTFGAIQIFTNDGRTLPWGFTCGVATETDRQAMRIVASIRARLG